MTVWLVGAGVLAGVAIGGSVAYWSLHARHRRLGRHVLPPDVAHVLDLMRRAHGAVMACFVTEDGSLITSVQAEEPPESVMDRAVDLARHARWNTHTQIVREGNVFVAVGDGGLGTCVMLQYGDVGVERPEETARDLRRWLGELRVARVRTELVFEDPKSARGWYSAGSSSLEGVAFPLCEAVHRETGRATALAVRDPEMGVTTVLAVSVGADRRLLGSKVRADSAVGRACAGDIPTEGYNAMELFGHATSERRCREERGTAFPVLDGGRAVGALVVFGPPDTLRPAVRERIMWYAVDAGARLAGAREARFAETQALADKSTGLPNRAALDRVVLGWTDGPCALVVVEITDYEVLIERHGPAAGNAALAHVAAAVRNGLREDDLPARLEGAGARFAAWLPHTPFLDAALVADRILTAINANPLEWGGDMLELACTSSHVAIPETVQNPKDLVAAAERALAVSSAGG